MKYLSFFLTGLIFGIGLVISGMANPQKVQNFLDIFGTWDPSLAFVMGGAIAITLPGYLLIQKKLNRPLFSSAFHWPTRTDLDFNLITGSILFGIGWGLGGLCPGPALVALASLSPGVLVFVAAMLFGMWTAKMLKRMGLKQIPSA